MPSTTASRPAMAARPVWAKAAPMPAPMARDGAKMPPGAPEADDGEDDLRAELKDHERGRIIDALSAERGSRKRAAERLGISPRTLRHKLAQLRARGVDIPGDAA